MNNTGFSYRLFTYRIFSFFSESLDLKRLFRLPAVCAGLQATYVRSVPREKSINDGGMKK